LRSGGRAFQSSLGEVRTLIGTLRTNKSWLDVTTYCNRETPRRRAARPMWCSVDRSASFIVNPDTQAMWGKVLTSSQRARSQDWRLFKWRLSKTSPAPLTERIGREAVTGCSERTAAYPIAFLKPDCRQRPTKPPKTEQPKGPTKAKARISFECVDSIQYEAFHSAMSMVATRRARSNSTSLFLSLAEQSARLFFALRQHTTSHMSTDE
jgi:hypothetical protein